MKVLIHSSDSRLPFMCSTGIIFLLLNFLRLTWVYLGGQRTYKNFWSRLQKGNHCSCWTQLYKIFQASHYLKSCRTIQACRNLILCQTYKFQWPQTFHVLFRWCLQENTKIFFILDENVYSRVSYFCEFCMVKIGYSSLATAGHFSFIKSLEMGRPRPEKCLLNSRNTVTLRLGKLVTMKRVRLGPAIISPVVTLFFWPPDIPLIIWLPTYKELQCCTRWRITNICHCELMLQKYGRQQSCLLFHLSKAEASFKKPLHNFSLDEDRVEKQITVFDHQIMSHWTSMSRNRSKYDSEPVTGKQGRIPS